jgi:hypothetical protein
MLIFRTLGRGETSPSDLVKPLIKPLNGIWFDHWWI